MSISRFSAYRTPPAAWGHARRHQPVSSGPSSLVNSGVVAFGGNTRIANSQLTNRGFLDVNDSQLSTSKLTNAGVFAANHATLIDTNVTNRGFGDLSNSRSVTSQLSNGGVLATAGSQFDHAAVSNSGFLNLSNSRVTDNELRNTGVLAAEGAHLGSSVVVSNAGFLNLGSVFIDDAVAPTPQPQQQLAPTPSTPVQSSPTQSSPTQSSPGQSSPTTETTVPDTPVGGTSSSGDIATSNGAAGPKSATTLDNHGVATANGAHLANATVGNSGWLNLDGVNTQQDTISNHGVMTANGAHLEKNSVTNASGFLNTNGANLANSTVSNHGVMSIHNAAEVTKVTGLPKYPGTTIVGTGFTTISGYDLSDVTTIINPSGFLTVNANGTLRPDIKIVNHGVTAVHDAGKLDGGDINNATGMLSID
jgi:hypothetical protein